ncbi:type VII secretion-associated serine protease mycosin [Kitasatospora sp. NPDC049285]|uniref:type VII secretion-associated serine protease mycosin n=1 Tax=Kitasatospora sp. NPDC049285 TaxID=3157096 RepID=UPI00341732F8
MSSGSLRRAGAVLLVLGVVGSAATVPAYAEPSPSPSPSSGAQQWSPISIAAAGDCKFPAENVKSKPWALQRVFLDELWKGPDKDHPRTGRNAETGKPVLVAVIDTGVDAVNPQLAGKVQNGGSLLKNRQNGAVIEGTGLDDPVGHGTKVAGIIAASPMDGVGFVGLAKDAQILSIRQNDAEGNGDVGTLVDAIKIALDTHVQVINISQDVRVEEGKAFDHQKELEDILTRAENENVVVVASSGNDGNEGLTYPASYDTVLAVGASDRNNERAPFSQYGDFVDVAAPGVDMLSTVPKGGQCTDNGTSFSAPYVSGLAAILKGAYPHWTAQQIRTRIEQTAQRNERDRNKFIGWGVVDPVKAVESSVVTGPSESPHADAPVKLDSMPLVAQPLGLAETQADRDRRTGTFVLGAGALVVAGLAGGAIVSRDMRRRRGQHE